MAKKSKQLDTQQLARSILDAVVPDAEARVVPLAAEPKPEKNPAAAA